MIRRSQLIVTVIGLVMLGRPAAAGGLDLLTKLEPESSVPSGFGWSVLLHEDMLLAGTPWRHLDSEESGSVVVYREVGAAWEIDQIIDPTDGTPGDQFGKCLAVDGEYLIVGAPNALNEDGERTGAVYIYHHGNSRWKEMAKIIAPDAVEGDWFGHAVSISGDRILVGSGGDGYAGYSEGAAYVFKRATGSSWPLEQEITPSDLEESDHFGVAVLLDGTIAYVGVSGDNAGGPEDDGSVQIFSRNDTTGEWERIQRVVPEDPGYSIAFGFRIERSGDAIAISDPNWRIEPPDEGENEDHYLGAVYLYTRQGDGTLLFDDMITAPEGCGYWSDFGMGLEFSGSRLFISAPKERIAQYEGSHSWKRGAIYVYEEVDSEWIQAERLPLAIWGPINGVPGDLFAVRDDLLAVGLEEWDDEPRGGLGAVYLFDIGAMGIPASIDDMDLRVGENLRGGFGKLRQSDDVAVKADSVWDAEKETHRTRVHFDAQAILHEGELLTVTIEAAVDEPAAKLKVYVKDWQVDRWVKVAARPIGTDDRRFVLSDLNPARFVRDDGSVRVRVETRLDLPLSGEYTASIDQLDVGTR